MYAIKLKERFMYYTVDRIEEDFAVLIDENGAAVSLKLAVLSDNTANIRENDILKFENGVYSADIEKTEQTKKDMTKRINKVFLNLV
jgi:CHAD domain-containing protein